MTDPLRSDHPPEAGEVPERERDARVEKLLLTGLDHYFTGQYELAISVWTRVLFLDRGHARAKAYIDRARSAVAERQREGEELLHTGVAAFDRGDAAAARDLLKSAVERGAASDEALSVLERLNRLEHANARPAPALVPRPVLDEVLDVPLAIAERTSPSRAIWVSTGVLAGLAAAGVVAWVALTRPGWLPVRQSSTTPATAQTSEPIPVPAPSEISLARARTLYENGRLRDAMAVLASIGQSDPLKRDADELRAAIQRRLLESARTHGAGSGGVAPASK
jgi:tetratricopeptide (TPR) repeat protein